MAFRTGTSGGVVGERGLHARGRSRLIAAATVLTGLGAAATVMVAAPVATTWVMVAALESQGQRREPIAPAGPIRAEPARRLAHAASFPAFLRPESIRPYDPPPVAEAPEVVATEPQAAPAATQTASLEIVPLPPISPAAAARRPGKDTGGTGRAGGMQLAAVSTPVAPPGEERSAVQRLFDALTPRSQPREDEAVGSVTAYANPGAPLGDNHRVAVYDITGRTVHMPNGEKLEAHSGLGPAFDNPRFVHVRMRGATPPHTYRLSMRERLFHGVAAIRMTPVGEGNMFGRDGILAHTYMLGPRGESNGCVSFRDYPRFLQAFRRGEVTHMIVVAHLTEPPARVIAAKRANIRYAAGTGTTRR